MSGGKSGTSGATPLPRGFLAVVIAGGLVIGVVNATTILLEAERNGNQIRVWSPFLLEFSSMAVIVALAPFVGRALLRFPFRRETIGSFLLVHLALSAVFSLAHVFGMWVVRLAGYALAGEVYDFFGDGVAVTLFYEWRKDLVSYMLILLIFWAFQRRTAKPETSETDRIEIRDGATAIFLAARDILWVESAGNYVEFHTADRSHMVRGTLADWERRLAERGFARVHKSRIVNLGRIGSIRTKPSGDLTVVLDSGTELAASRRYRAALEPPAA
jgi:hypothetical protein